MADLSKLSDEQLAVYRDMLTKKNTPAAPPTRIDQAINNIPSSLIRTVTSPYGEGMPASVQENYKPGEYPPQFQDYIPGIKKFIAHPIDTTVNAIKDQFTNNPVGSTLGAAALMRGAAPETAGKIDAGITGGVSAAARNVRPILDKFSIWHPLKNIGTVYDAAANTVQGVRDAINPPKTSPFDVRAVKSPPSSGGMPFNPKPVEGGGGQDLPKPADISGLPDPGKTGNPKLAKQLLKKTSSKDVRSVARPGIVGSGDVSTPPSASTDSGPNSSDIPGGQDPNASSRLGKQLLKRARDLGKDTSGSLNLGRFGGSGSGLEVPVGEAPATQVRPVSAAGTQVPEPPTTQPSAPTAIRPVIRDEHGNALMYSDTKAPDIDQPSQEIRPVQSSSPMDKPYEEMQRRRASDENNDPDAIYRQIANEGIEKRIVDAKNKYNDVYNTHIKGQMTPDDVRNLATDPEAKTQMDLKIKAMKHPEDHPKAGQKKYSSGLNPAVIDSLATRLENDSQAPQQ